MSNVSIEKIKELREKTGVGMMDSKNALKESDGDIEKAIVLLREKGLAGLAKRAGRETKEGMIESYVHANNKIGVLVEVNCETDFVAKNEKFKEFAHNVALQIAASNPLYISEDVIPEEVLNGEKVIYTKQAKESGKPDNVVEKIVEGKIKKYFEEVVLLNQAYVKNPDLKINDYLGEVAASLGENIIISRFVRLELGQ